MVPDGSEVLHFPGPIKIKGKRGFLKEEELKLLDLTVFDWVCNLAGVSSCQCLGITYDDRYDVYCMLKIEHT